MADTIWVRGETGLLGFSHPLPPGVTARLGKDLFRVNADGSPWEPDEADEAEAAGAEPEAEAEAGPVPVADQLAAGVDPGDTVTMADQRAGAEAPQAPGPESDDAEPQAEHPAPLAPPVPAHEHEGNS
jgi:hypothetical protein